MIWPLLIICLVGILKYAIFKGGFRTVKTSLCAITTDLSIDYVTKLLYCDTSTEVLFIGTIASTPNMSKEQCMGTYQWQLSTIESATVF